MLRCFPTGCISRVMDLFSTNGIRGYLVSMDIASFAGLDNVRRNTNAYCVSRKHVLCAALREKLVRIFPVIDSNHVNVLLQQNLENPSLFKE